MNDAGPSSPPVSMLKHGAARDAVRLALVMTQSLPVAVRPMASIGQGAQP